MQCIMPTRKLRTCKRPATVRYIRDGRVIASYCAQHDSNVGGRHLRPYAWEYDSKETTDANL